MHDISNQAANSATLHEVIYQPNVDEPKRPT